MKKEKVIFLIEKDSEHNVFAYFPKYRYNDDDENLFMSYSHVGQHSACSSKYAAECKEANPSQYNSLKTELESFGYKLNVLNRNSTYLA